MDAGQTHNVRIWTNLPPHRDAIDIRIVRDVWRDDGWATDWAEITPDGVVWHEFPPFEIVPVSLTLNGLQMVRGIAVDPEEGQALIDRLKTFIDHPEVRELIHDTARSGYRTIALTSEFDEDVSDA